MRRSVVHDVGYATVIASRKDAAMYLATIWFVVRSDNDVDVSEQILFEQIRHAIFESLRLKGWFGDDKTTDDNFVPSKGYKEAHWAGKGGIKEWLDDLKRGNRELLTRSLIADIYRIIWRDGCFSIGEKRVVEEIVEACGLDSNVAYGLCFNVGLAEYFGRKVGETIESGKADVLTKRNNANGEPRTFREEVDVAKDRIGDLNFRLILYKTGFWLALPFILFNLYLFWNQGVTGEVISELAETARISENRITQEEYDLIRECSRRLKFNSDKDVYNHIVYGMTVGATNSVAGVACRERGRRKIIKEGKRGRAEVSLVSDIATSMIDVALVDGVELDPKEEEWVVGYLKSWGLDEKIFSISNAVEELKHRREKMIGLGETSHGEKSK